MTDRQVTVVPAQPGFFLLLPQIDEDSDRYVGFGRVPIIAWMVLPDGVQDGELSKGVEVAPVCATEVADDIAMILTPDGQYQSHGCLFDGEKEALAYMKWCRDDARARRSALAERRAAQLSVVRGQ